MPMAAHAHGRGDRLRWSCCCWLIEGRRALRIDLDLGRFLLLGLMMASFFAFYALGIQFSNPITAATVQVAGPAGVGGRPCGW